MTNFKKIKAMGVEQVAKYIYIKDDVLCDEICKSNYPCNHGDDVEPDDCIRCIKNWLESEAEKDG